MATHLKFVEQESTTKTRKWWVVNKHDDTPLGNIGWFSRWRCYAFYPLEKTVFEQVCLRDIATFCKNATDLHKEKLKKAKANG